MVRGLESEEASIWDGGPPLGNSPWLPTCSSQVQNLQHGLQDPPHRQRYPPVACGHSGSTSLPAPLHAPAPFLEALRRFAATGTFCIPFPGHLLSPAEILCLFLSPAQMPQPPGSLPVSLPWEGPLCHLEALGHGPVFSLVSQLVEWQAPNHLSLGPYVP